MRLAAPRVGPAAAATWAALALAPALVLGLAVGTGAPSPHAPWPDLWVVLLETHAFVLLLGLHAAWMWRPREEAAAAKTEHDEVKRE